MNLLLQPVSKIGCLTIEKIVGGEKTVEQLLPIESAKAEMFRFYSTWELKAYLSRLEREGLYQIENGILRKKEDFNELKQRRKEVRVEIQNRKQRWIKIHNNEWKKSIKIETSMNNQEFDYEIVSEKGDIMNYENKIHIREEYTDEFGVTHEERVTKECILPYKKEKMGLKKKDIIILHRSGRLGVSTPSGKIVSSIIPGIPEDDDGLQKLFKTFVENGGKFYVLLPKGGAHKKEFGEKPSSPWSSYTIRNNKVVPIEKVGRKIYQPEIDGRTPKGREVISEYRGDSSGYTPVYQYDEELHERMYVDKLLSYNHITYSDKSIILIGTKEAIRKADKRIKSANKWQNGYHNFTNQRIVGFNGQNNRCENNRIVPTEDGVQVIGLNLKGTPEEDLKGYLRSFDRIPPKRDNKEAKELLEIAHERDGRQTILNIEHDIRAELKHLKTRSSKELYFLILGVEEEVEGTTPNKKEQALLNVLESFKSSMEIHENEGKGLTSDIEDLVTIEEGANDSSYKKSKNLYSQQMGILNRNQNPLNMKGKFETLEEKKWVQPKRTKPQTKRPSAPDRIRVYKTFSIPGMFQRGFRYSIRVGDEESFRLESGGKGFASSKKKEKKPSYKNIIITYPVTNSYPILRKEAPKKEPCVFETSEDCKEKSKQLEEECIRYITENMKIVPPRGKRVPLTVTGWELPHPLLTKTFLDGVKEEAYYGKWKPGIRYRSQKGKISTVRLFDDRNNPGPVMKEVSYKTFKASMQKPYQFSGKIVFDEEAHEFVRINPHSSPSSMKILHTIKDEESLYYIIEINGQKLYAKGNISLLDWSSHRETISFTGTRNPSKETKLLVKDVVERFLDYDPLYVTVSGGANGCDSIVHSTTIANGSQTIIVLAGGWKGQFTRKGQLETILKNGGLILSEHPPEYRPTKRDFVLRNKIIASLSDRLVVFEAGNGTMHCAKFGLELKKDLIIQSGFELNDRLIKSGIGRKLETLEELDLF